MVTDSSTSLHRNGLLGQWIHRLRIPVHDVRFWIIQVLVLAIDVAHTWLEDVHLLVGTSELYLLSVSAFLIPVVYAGLSFGMRGAVPTALWALVLSLPEISHHDRTTKAGILAQFAIVLAIAVIVALRVDRERAASRALEHANQQLSKLNATAAAVAGSLDLDEVLRGTLRATLDPLRQQVVWVRLTRSADLPDRTDVAATGREPLSGLDPEQAQLTGTALEKGVLQTDGPTPSGAHSLVVPLRSEGQVVGGIGLTQPLEPISPDEFQVHAAIANQLSVALNNISTHQRNREALRSLEVAKANLETYIELATDAQEEERKRLSRELHDDILQSLVVARGQIETARGTEPVPGDDRLARAQQVLDDAIANVRRYSRDLRPAVLDDLGLVDAVDWLVGDMRVRTGIELSLEVAGTPHRLGSRDELHIFRVVQEALHNVERHALATRARVCLLYGGRTLTVRVVDDGRGMTREPSAGSGTSDGRGLGLRGMDERTKLLEGTLTIASRAGSGTELTLEVPMQTAGSESVTTRR